MKSTWPRGQDGPDLLLRRIHSCTWRLDIRMSLGKIEQAYTLPYLALSLDLTQIWPRGQDWCNLICSVIFDIDLINDLTFDTLAAKSSLSSGWSFFETIVISWMRFQTY